MRWRRRRPDDTGEESLVERAKARAEQFRLEAEEARAHRPAVDFAFRVRERDRAAFGSLLAGALAYRFFLFLIPFVLLIVSVTGLATGPGDADEVNTAFGLRGLLAEALATATQQSTSALWVLIGAGLGGSLWAGARCVWVLQAAHCAAWGVPLRKLRVVRAALYFLGANVAIAALPTFASWVRQQTLTGGLVVTIAVMAVWFVTWLVISSVLAHGGASVLSLVPGAALVALGAEVLHLVTVYLLVGQAERASSIYGAIGIAVTTLAWLFIIARLIVFSAVVNAVTWEMFSGREVKTPDLVSRALRRLERPGAG